MAKTQEFKVKSVTPAYAIFTNDNPYQKVSLLVLKVNNTNIKLSFQVQFYKVEDESLVDGPVLETETIIPKNNQIVIDLDGLYLVKELVVYNKNEVPAKVKPTTAWFLGLGGVIARSEIAYNIPNQDFVALTSSPSQYGIEVLPEFNPVTVQNKLRDARKIELIGDVVGDQYFDGSGDIQIPTTVKLQIEGIDMELLNGQTQLNTPNSIVKRNQNGDFYARFVNQDLNGNQATASKLKTQGQITLSGQVTGSQLFDGSGQITIDTQFVDLPIWSVSAAANTLVQRDENGDIKARRVEQDLIGNQDTATKLKTQQTIQLNGQVTGSQSFDGSGNITIITQSEQLSSQTSQNTAATLVKRDESGNFAAGTITQSLNGNQSTASKLQTPRLITLTGQTVGSQEFDGSSDITIHTQTTELTSGDIADQTSDNEPLKIVKRDSNGDFQARIITQTLDGNQATATKLKTQRTISLSGQVTGSQDFDGSGQITIETTMPDILNQTNQATPSTLVKRDANGDFQARKVVQDLTGNQDTATKLKTPQTIQLSGFVTGSQTFDGSQGITINTTKQAGQGDYLELSGGTLTGNVLFQTPAQLQLGSQSTNLTQGTNTQLKVSTQYGYVLVGPQDQNQAHFQTDKNAYSFDKQIELNTTQIKYANAIMFDWNSKTGDSENHQIVSKDQNGQQANSLRINSQGSVYINIDSDQNSTAEVFQVYKDGGTEQLTEQNRLMYVNELGEFYATKVYGQVYNDYAEYRETQEHIEPGYVQISDNGKLRKCDTDRARNIAGVVSDVFGFQIGQTETQTTPVQVQGRALVYCEDQLKVKPGDQVCATKHGKVRKMSWLEKILHPESIVGFVDELPTYDTWGNDNIPVNGRIWIRLG